MVLVGIHVLILWRATDGTGVLQSNTAAGSERALQNNKNSNNNINNGPVVIPFVVSMTNCGEDPFMEGVSWLEQENGPQPIDKQHFSHIF